jgi:hypothetical protein
MATQESPIRRKVRDAAAALQMKSSRQTLAHAAKSLVERTLGEWGAVTVESHGRGAFGLESYEAIPTRNQNFDVARDANVDNLMKNLQEMGMSQRHVEQTAEACLTLFDDGYKPADVVRNNIEVSGAHASMSAVVGRTSAGLLARLEDGVGLEAFGDDVNRLASDDRVTMDLMIMRPWDNIMDKALARVSDASPIVTIKVPSPEAYDWATTQQANSTVQTRSGSSNTYRLRDLYRNPTPVNSQPKKILPLQVNDTRGVVWNNTYNSATPFYKTGQDISLLDLSRDTSRYTYDHVDRTDLVADGGLLDNVIVSITDPNGGNAVTEYFQINTRPIGLAMFVPSPANKSSGQRQVIMEAILVINSTTTQVGGTASTIAAHFTDGKLQIRVRINATMNIQTGLLQASGTTNATLVPLAGGAQPSNATATYTGNLTSQLAAYSVDTYFDEENQRKANLAIWVQYYEQQFVIPRGRIYFTEYALTQDMDENAVATTSSVMALGNGRRGLNIVVNALNDICSTLSYVNANPEIAQASALDDQSFASALVKPTVVTTILDFNTEELNTMNESTRLSEIHGRFRARFLEMVSMLMAKSLMLNQYKGGEVPVIKAWVHSTIADLVIGITDYHPDLQDRSTTATGADYSMTLPNGYRLDVIKTNLDCMQQRLYAVPVIESDMTSVLSAASIRDCGTITTNYTPTNVGGSVTRRMATSTREIVMMSNKVGICMIIQGLQAQVGNFGYNTVALAQDYSDSLAL